METVALLLILLFIVIIILPISAFARASEAKRLAEELVLRLDPLEQEVHRLRRELREKPSSQPSATPTERPHRSHSEVLERITERQPLRPDPQPVAKKISVPKEPPPAPPPLPRVEETVTATEPEAIESRFSLDRINWEQFMGVRLFAWLGGFALFLAAAFLMKYSFDHGLIPPAMRVTLGFIVGLGLVGGGIRMSQKKYKITADTLCATGIVILYAVTFACRSVYHFPAFQAIPTFLLMTVITGAAFLLSVRLNAMVVAVLGMLGGFLTPILVNTGQDNPFGLFTYIALLDIGLISVALARRWNWLTFAAAIGTALMQLAWVVEFFNPEKVFIAMAVFLGFCGLFLAANRLFQKRGIQNVWLDVATMILPGVTFLFVPILIANGEIGTRPGILYSFILGADLTLIGLAISQCRYRIVQQISGGIAFLLLAVWTMTRVDDSLLFWALGGYLLFALLHTLLPIYLHQRNPDEPLSNWAQLFPVITLLITVIPMLKIDASSGLIWPFVLIINVVALGLAVMAASLASLLIVLLVTAGLAFLWVLTTPTDLGGMILVLGGFATFFTLAGVFGGRSILDRLSEEERTRLSNLLPAGWAPEDLQRQIPALSAILPFLLVVMVTARLDLVSPAPVFGFGLGLGALALGLTRAYRLDWLPAIGFGCTFILENVWHLRHFTVENAGVSLVWYIIFAAVYFAFPFGFLRGRFDQTVSWVTAVVAVPFQFTLVLNVFQRVWPSDFMGIIPAAFAVPVIIGLAWLIGAIPADHLKRNTLLAWFGGIALLFITLIFPIQFERQWLTIAWALEGAALLWLFGRVPHHGLRYTGLALLTVAFCRLALNVYVLDYSPRSEIPIFNWYLYTYGLVIAAMFLGAKLLRKPNHEVMGRDVRPALVTMGTVLAFILMNIEIADFFTKPGEPKLVFKFSGDFARDMTYTIGWALFAFVLMLIGILNRVRASRWAAIGLLGITLLKLFFHDLAALNQLYRVGALVGVAVIAIVVSFLYQKFLREQDPTESNESNPSNSI